MTEDELKRLDDRLIGQLSQKISDFIELSNEREKTAGEWRIKHDEDSLRWRTTIDDRLAPLEDWLNTANSSWKLIVGTITITGILFKGWDFVRAHWH